MGSNGTHQSLETEKAEKGFSCRGGSWGEFAEGQNICEEQASKAMLPPVKGAAGLVLILPRGQWHCSCHHPTPDAIAKILSQRKSLFSSFIFFLKPPESTRVLLAFFPHCSAKRQVRVNLYEEVLVAFQPSISPTFSFTLKHYQYGTFYINRP